MHEKRWGRTIGVLGQCGIDGIDGKIKKIKRYTELLRERREWAGLTSRAVSEEPEKEISETVEMIPVLGLGPSRVVEIGSGGGMLGIILAIVCTDWNITMVESSARKSAFLAEVVGELELGNVDLVNSRAERLMGYAEYDACISRAAGSLTEIAPIALGLLRRGGRYVALKSSEVSGEIEEAMDTITASGGKVLDVIHPLGTEEEAHPARASLVVIEKL